MALTIPVSEIVEKSSNPFLQIHSSWKRVLLDDIAEILNGFAFKSNKFSKSKGFPLLRIRDIGREYTDCFYDGPYDPNYVIKPGDLVIGMDGDFNCSRWSGPEALLNQRVCKVTIVSNYYNPKFLDIALPGYLKAINEKTSSVTVKHLSSKSIVEIPLPLPPLPEQQRIVTKIEELFTNLDTGIKALKTVKTQLKRYRQAVLKYAFEGELTREWRELHKEELEPALVLLERIKEEKMKNIKGKRRHKKLPLLDTYELPDGWIWVRTGDICEGIVPGRTKPKEFKGDIPWITLPDVKGLYISKSREKLAVTEEDANKVGMKVMPKGTVLMSCIGQFGIICIAKKQVVPNQQFHGFVCQNGIIPEFLAYSLMSQVEQMEKLSTATTISYLNQSKCNNLAVPLPMHGEQQKIVEEIEQRFSIIKKIEKTVDTNLKKAERLHQSILKKAFEGKLVPQNPNDEPAHILLERIKAEKSKNNSKKSKKKEKYNQKRLIDYGK
ncbi:MAG: restriction endonuclease subunit S [Candidatus Methanofastidiosia archaeon]|jgi:type I restriction enzyme S subunit